MAKKAAAVRKPATQPMTSKLNPGPPAPYTNVPPGLQDFLDGLSPKHVYITHIDRHPSDFKRQIFRVPIWMNILIVVLLALRVYYIAPFYAYMLMTIWGYETPYFVDVKQMAWDGIARELIRRMAPMVIDALLISIILPWPWNFFAGVPENPWSWRRSVGYQDAEIAVRRSRKWDQELSKNWLAEESDGTVYQERIMPAIDRDWVRTKSAYMMLDKSWDLDFKAMINAHKLVSAGKNTLSDFEKQVIVHHPDFGWLVWEIWKLDEGAQDDGRKMIVEFKDKLTAMGKESLFFRWIEIVQYESSQEGGFTQERQAKAMRDARKAFEAEGVDFDAFWKEVGGMENMPGMKD